MGHRARDVQPHSGPRTIPRPRLPGTAHRQALSGSPFALRNWRLPVRLVALIAIPTLLGVLFGVLRVTTANASAAAFGQVKQLALVGQQVTGLAQAVEDERDLTAGYIAAGRPVAALPRLEAQYQVTDGWASRVRALSEGVGPGYPASVQEKLSAALTKLTEMPGLRTTIEHGGAGLVPAILAYSTSVDDLLAFNEEIAQGSANSAVADTVAALSSLSRMEDDASQQRAVLYAGFIQGQFALGLPEQLTAAYTQQAADLQQFESSANGAQQQLFDDTVASAPDDQDQVVEQLAVDVGSPPLALGVSASQWYTSMSGTIERMRTVEGQLAASVVAQSQALQQGAQGSAALTSILTLSLLLVASVGTVIVARSLVNPLRVLRSDALDIASVRLPEKVRELDNAEDSPASVDVTPVSVHSTDEIGQVARAFDQVHREAVRLAGAEAMVRKSMNAMFVNLSRRSQSMLERLMRLVDSLESSEEDPRRLSSLFAMDHLITRMRRNSDNLLVLGGHEPARKRGEPVALSDVIRAAVSEILEYNRVVPDLQPGVSISGHSVSDVVHLLAEIIENATRFSPKDSQVQVHSQVVTTGGVLIEITDGGIGLPADQLAQLNWRLDSPPVIDVAASRHMGLFVVSHLAARHGVRVRLKSADRGLTALVWIPPQLISEDGGWPATQAGEPVLAAAPVAPAEPPIYRSVASEWFRHGRRVAAAPPAAAPPTAAPPARPDWRSPGDAGWRAAESAATPARGEPTAAGLPRRIPRTNMVPGSAGDRREPAGDQARGDPRRSAADARSLLSGFQRGNRTAQSKIRHDTGEQPG